MLVAGLIVLASCSHAQCRPDKANAAFSRGMNLARQKRWTEARKSLLAGQHICPGQKRFPIELAGVAFEQRQYPQAAKWLRQALKLAPKDKYANNFAGTVYYLMGNLPAALKYWNRIGKPHIHALNLAPELKVRPLILGRAFAFSPAALLTWRQYETTRARLDGLAIFPKYRIELTARKNGSFNANFHALERDGFGASRLQAAIATLSGLPYETIYPSYYNIDRSAINITSLLRWKAQMRRVWVSISAPVHELPQYRWRASFDARDENWAIRRSLPGTAPILGSLNLHKQAASFSLTDYLSGRFKWSLGAELSHRSYRNVKEGTALTPAIVLPGMELQSMLSLTGKPVDIPQRRLSITTSMHLQAARIWSTPSHAFEKLQGAALLRWFPSQQSNRWEIKQELRGGGLLGASPFDSLFILGMDRDNALWLRGDLAARGGRKGSAPMGTRYFLSNNDLYRSIYSNGLIRIQAGPLFDAGRMGAPTAGLAASDWIFDTGIETRITVLGTRVVLIWGHNLHTGGNVFFGATH